MNNGFKQVRIEKESIFMRKILMDFNKATLDVPNHKYSYNFDFDVIHPFMVRSFEPFFKQGNVLELGSYKGNFTTRIMKYFDDITCVEASNDAIAIAKEKHKNVTFYCDTFENVNLPKKYDNIILLYNGFAKGGYCKRIK